MINSITNMKIYGKKIILFVLLIFVLFSLNIIPQEDNTETTKESVTGTQTDDFEVLYHDEGDMTENFMKYWGNVDLVWDKYRIYADYVEYNVKTKGMSYNEKKAFLSSLDPSRFISK